MQAVQLCETAPPLLLSPRVVRWERRVVRGRFTPASAAACHCADKAATRAARAESSGEGWMQRLPWDAHQRPLWDPASHHACCVVRATADASRGDFRPEGSDGGGPAPAKQSKEGGREQWWHTGAQSKDSRGVMRDPLWFGTHAPSAAVAAEMEPLTARVSDGPS